MTDVKTISAAWAAYTATQEALDAAEEGSLLDRMDA